MRIDKNSFSGDAAATTTVDLNDLAAGDVQQAKWCNHPANFDVEVLGNDAAVTLKGKGPFSTSVAQDVTGGSFAIGGGKIAIQGFALKEMEFTTAGGAYTINIVRAVE